MELILHETKRLVTQFKNNEISLDELWAKLEQSTKRVPFRDEYECAEFFDDGCKKPLHRRERCCA